MNFVSYYLDSNRFFYNKERYYSPEDMKDVGHELVNVKTNHD